MTGDWGREVVVYIDRLRNLYSSTNIIKGFLIKKDKRSGACSTYGGEDKCIQNFGRETYRKKTIWKVGA